MSDKPTAQTTPTQLELIAAAAIASVRPTADMTEKEWQRKVIRRASTIQRMRFLQEDSVMMNVLNSVKIKAKIEKVEFEESSSRYVITYRPSNKPDKTETIRTPITDSYAGSLILPDIEKVKKCAGTDQDVIIFKFNDMPSEERAAAARAAGQMVPTSGYRQAVWFDFA